MNPERDVTTDPAKDDEPIPFPPPRSYGSHLNMPMDDDPAGDGHMWSGKSDLPPEPEADEMTAPLGEHGGHKKVDEV